MRDPTLTAQSETLQELIGRFRGVRGKGAVLSSVATGASRIVAA